MRKSFNIFENPKTLPHKKRHLSETWGESLIWSEFWLRGLEFRVVSLRGLFAEIQVIIKDKKLNRIQFVRH